MVGGVEKYFQIAKCFRDEDLRADRQPEFTQIDIEASFVDAGRHLRARSKECSPRIFQAARGVEIPTPFPRLTYREAMDEYGSDKPDRRFGMELVDLGDDFRASSFKVFRGALDAGGVVKAINAKGFAGTDDRAERRADRDGEELWRERTRFHQGGERRMEIADREIFHRSREGGAALETCRSRKAI